MEYQVMAHTKAEDNPSGLRELMANMIFTQKFFQIKTISFFFFNLTPLLIFLMYTGFSY